MGGGNRGVATGQAGFPVIRVAACVRGHLAVPFPFVAGKAVAGSGSLTEVVVLADGSTGGMRGPREGVRGIHAWLVSCRPIFDGEVCGRGGLARKSRVPLPFVATVELGPARSACGACCRRVRRRGAGARTGKLPRTL